MIEAANKVSINDHTNFSLILKSNSKILKIKRVLRTFRTFKMCKESNLITFD